jgi:hypothetical protein
MAPKKNKKKQTKKVAKKRASTKHKTPAKKKAPARKKTLRKGKAQPLKAPSKKQFAPKKASSNKLSKGRPPKRTLSSPHGKSESVATVPFEPHRIGSDSAGQSGDLQGLSKVASADSESVDELLEEGNAYEAEAVEGVEDARDPDRGEVRTREVPEDDVPGEYLEKDE